MPLVLIKSIASLWLAFFVSTLLLSTRILTDILLLLTKRKRKERDGEGSINNPIVPVQYSHSWIKRWFCFLVDNLVLPRGDFGKLHKLNQNEPMIFICNSTLWALIQKGINPRLVLSSSYFQVPVLGNILYYLSATPWDEDNGTIGSRTDLMRKEPLLFLLPRKSGSPLQYPMDILMNSTEKDAALFTHFDENWVDREKLIGIAGFALRFNYKVIVASAIGWESFFPKRLVLPIGKWIDSCLWQDDKGNHSDFVLELPWFHTICLKRFYLHFSENINVDMASFSSPFSQIPSYTIESLSNTILMTLVQGLLFLEHKRESDPLGNLFTFIRFKVKRNTPSTIGNILLPGSSKTTTS